MIHGYDNVNSSKIRVAMSLVFKLLIHRTSQLSFLPEEDDLDLHRAELTEEKANTKLRKQLKANHLNVCHNPFCSSSCLCFIPTDYRAS